MASLIRCPHCGARPKEEFTIRGAAVTRPQPDAGEDAWYAYVYLRDNPMGPFDEYWHHTSGCRRWLVVSRDTRTHETYGVRDAAAVSRESRS
ncbi:MAG TPA: sarcosine oxidase subunit delta [Tianweitania sediminis]|jgi:sarcosine oxidase subunit delta|nr:sarcosine oxidase subunit delta [Tianweitania sediminis]